MRTAPYVLSRGSTPCLELRLPFAPAAEDTVYLTFRQNGSNVLEYARSGTALSPGTGSLTLSQADGRILLAQMTQADTLRLEAGECELQVRVKSGDRAEVGPILRAMVAPVRKQGEI
jgi:hypothetical protein